MRVPILLTALLFLACPAPVAAQTLTAAERRAVVLGAADLIQQRYIYPKRGVEIARALRSAPDQFSQTDPGAFANAMTQKLRTLSTDGHFAVEYRTNVSDADNEATEQAHLAQMIERWYGKDVNHGFQTVQRLENGVGYLNLTVFPPPDIAGDMMQAAMTLLAQSPALIIDLRGNGGGMGEMAQMLAGYILDGSVEVSGSYDRPQDRHTRVFTPAWVPGRRFGGDRPVYILISKRTFSAAEGFSYDMQAIGRAKIVGEASGGGAHPFKYRAINPRFVISLPEGRSINPVTGGDWQGVGVRPDIPVATDQALDVALKLALAEITKQSGALGKPRQVPR